MSFQTIDEYTAKALRDGFAAVINRAGAEQASDTPDFLLAEHLIRCLDNYNVTVRNKKTWAGTE